MNITFMEEIQGIKMFHQCLTQTVNNFVYKLTATIPTQSRAFTSKTYDILNKIYSTLFFNDLHR